MAAIPNSAPTQSGTTIEPGGVALVFPDPSTGNGVVASGANPFPISTPTPSAPVTGQYKLTASAAAISSSTPLVNGIVVKAKSTNVGAAWIGPAGVTATDDGTGNGYRLLPGEAASFAISNISGIYAIGTANDVLYFEGN